MQLLDTHLANHVAFIAGNTARVKAERDFTIGLALYFAAHIPHDLHPRCALGRQCGEFNRHIGDCKRW